MPEIEAVEKIMPVHAAQPMTCLRLSNNRPGPLLDFNVPRLKNGVARRVL